MPRGRKALPAAQKKGPEFVGATPPDQALVEAQANKRLATLAKALHYEGDLREQTLEDDIAYHQRRSGESVLEIGKRLLLLKELTGHGRFAERLDAMGIHPRAAQRFMAIGLKFSKTTTSSLLEAAGSQYKLLELSLLDDEEIEALESGDAVGTITTDKLHTMSVRELRNEIKKLQGRVEDQDGRIDKLTKENEKVSQRADKAARVWRAAKPDDQRQTLEQAVQQAAAAVRDAIGAGDEPTGLSGAVHALADHAEQHGYDAGSVLGDVFARLLIDVQRARDDETLPVAIPIHAVTAEG